MQTNRQIPIVTLICLPILLSTFVSCDNPISSARALEQEAAKLDAAAAKLEELSEIESSSSEAQDTSSSSPEEQEKKAQKQTIEIPKTWKRLSEQHEIWVDKKAKEVIVAGTVCLNQGPLEMFICPEGTKEHESIISANALSSEVHGALLFLGANPGKACSWDPEYRPAYGPSIEITLKWQDEKTKKTVTQSARQWIRNVNTKKPLAQQWVFGGSQFWKDPDTKEEVYYGDSGEMICLSNFSTATIDLNVESSDSNAGLLFEAFTENIPPVGTKVYAIIKPGKRIEPAKKTDNKKRDKSTEKEKTGKQTQDDESKPESKNPDGDQPADSNNDKDTGGVSKSDKR